VPLAQEDRVKAFRILLSQDARNFLAQIRTRWGSALFADQRKENLANMPRPGRMAGARANPIIRPNFYSEDRFKRRLGCRLLPIDAYPDGSAADHSEFSRRCTANIDDLSAAVGTPVIDAHDHGPTVANVGDAHLRSEGKRTMRSGKPIWAGHFAAGGAATMIVPGPPRFGPSGPTKANEITTMAKALMVIVHQYHGTDRAVRLASQPIPMFSEFAAYTDYRSWDMVDGRSYGLA
jgi:hypothetical protein